MDWGTVAQWFGVLATFLAINAATVQWLLSRREDQRFRDLSRVEEIAKALYDLKVNLPLEYVRRDDWIRFAGTIDAKIDQLRDEMREELRELKVSNG